MLSKIMVDRETHQHICYECNQIFESEGLLPTTIDCAWCMKSTDTKGQLISERNFSVFKSYKKMNQILEGFLPLPLKWVRLKNE